MSQDGNPTQMVAETSREPSETALLSPQDLPVWTPFTDIFETNEAMEILLDLPGVDAEQLEITLEQNTLEVRGSASSPQNPEGARPLWMEFQPSNFSRRFLLTDQMAREGIQANLNQGVLRITVPKVKEHIARRIPISSG